MGSYNISVQKGGRIQRQFQQGKPTSIDMFGFKFVKGKLEIVPEEAALLRKAAEMYLAGATQEDLEVMFQEAMDRREFDPEQFKKKVKEIQVPENGLLIFIFMDGHIVEKNHNFQWI